MNRGVVGMLIARKSVSPVFEPWHWLVQVINSACGDAVCDVFKRFEKRNSFHKSLGRPKAGVERRSHGYKALVSSTALLCMMAI